jgi:hypothetical protein
LADAAPAAEPRELTEAPVAVEVSEPLEACDWSGREGEPALPVVLRLDAEALREGGHLDPALACAPARNLEIVVRLVPPTSWQQATDPYAAVAHWLGDLEAFLQGNADWLHTVILSPAPGGGLESRSFAFLVEKTGTLLKSCLESEALVLGPLSGSSATWLQELPRWRIHPYIDAIAVPDRDGIDGSAGVTVEGYEGMPVWLSLRDGLEAEALILRLFASRWAGGRTVLIPSRLGAAARRAALSLVRLLPSRYVPDPRPQSITMREPEGGRVLAWLADTLGPERVVLLQGPPSGEPLRFTLGPDPLRSLEAFDLDTGRELSGQALSGQEGAAGTEVHLARARGPVLVRYVSLDGPRAEPEAIGVTASYELTAPEIIARLRAVEESQKRAIQHYRSTATLSYHYRAEALNESIDVTSLNRFYWRGGVGEYEEMELYINGARWRGEAPSLPFIQAEKVKEVPIEVRLDASYGYRLVGRDRIDGRSAYVLEFDPVPSAGSLYSGRVWVDAETFVRRRIRLVQHGLKTPITSNEDVIDYGPAPGSGEGYWVPLSAYRQMVFTVLGRAVVVERRITFQGFVFNEPDFQAKRRMAYATNRRISRDDEDGFAYMIRQPGGARLRKSASLRNVAFFGGLSVGAPVVSSPVAGLNYFDFDWRGTGTQVDVAWAGPFLNAAWTDPALGHSRWELSAEGRLMGVREKLKRTTDDGRRRSEDLDVLEERAFVTVARPLTSHSKGEMQLHVSHEEFDPTDSTGDGMEIPADLMTTTALARWRYHLSGVSLDLWGSSSWRSDWDDWGLRAGASGEAEDKRFNRWGLKVSKSFFAGPFQKVGLGLSLDAGSGLDRFSRFRLGDFRTVRVQGFSSADIGFDRGASAQLSYQVTLPRTGVSLRLNLSGAVLENREDFLDRPEDRAARNGDYREHLVGGGLGVSFNGPWGTLMTVSGSRRIDTSMEISGGSTSLRILMVKTFGDWPWKREPVETVPRAARLEPPGEGDAGPAPPQSEKR